MGDGWSINIWKNAWLGGNGSGKIISPPRSHDTEASIASLIDSDRICWHMDIINDAFLQVDVDRILRIPISKTKAQDERIWAASDDGSFRVQDAYRLALNAYPVASCSSGNDPIWSKISKMHIHPKAKVFLWRVAWDAV